MSDKRNWLQGINQGKKEQQRRNRSASGYKRAINATCPKCNRMNAYFKIKFDFPTFGYYKKHCRYCGYWYSFNPQTRVRQEGIDK